MTELALLFSVVSQIYDLPPGLLSAICEVESNHDVNAYVHDDGGSPSIGICQLKMGTASDLGFKGTVLDLHDVHTNVRFAGLYLRRKLDTYGGDVDRAICAYNRGSCKPGQGVEYRAKVRKIWEGQQVAPGTHLNQATKALPGPLPMGFYASP